MNITIELYEPDESELALSLYDTDDKVAEKARDLLLANMRQAKAARDEMDRLGEDYYALATAEPIDYDATQKARDAFNNATGIFFEIVRTEREKEEDEAEAFLHETDDDRRERAAGV